MRIEAVVLFACGITTIILSIIGIIKPSFLTFNKEKKKDADYLANQARGFKFCAVAGIALIVCGFMVANL